MKKAMYLMLMIAAMVFTACGNEEEGMSLSFEKQTYTLTSGTISVRLIVSNAPATATELPVTFGGNAVQGEDYTVSATKYVIGGNSQMLSIDVTAKNNFSTPKNITMSVSGAASASTTINLGVKDKMLYSFSQKAYVLGGETEVVLNLLNSKTGEALTAENDINVTIAPDAKSTAVEGTHYEILNKTATILKGTSACVFKLKALKTEEGKNSIVLAPQMKESEGFVAGRFPMTTVSMIGSYASDLMGTWMMQSIETDKEFMNGLWGLGEAELKGFPEFNEGDTFTFGGDGKDGLSLTTDLKSDWKNYFRESSSFSIDKEITLRTNNGGKITLQLLRLANVNRFFSATEVSDDKEALVAVRNIKDKDGETLLDVYVIDYYSKSFFPSFITYEMYDANKPVAMMSGVYLHFILKKKK